MRCRAQFQVRSVQVTHAAQVCRSQGDWRFHAPVLLFRHGERHGARAQALPSYKIAQPHQPLRHHHSVKVPVHRTAKTWQPKVQDGMTYAQHTSLVGHRVAHALRAVTADGCVCFMAAWQNEDITKFCHCGKIHVAVNPYEESNRSLAHGVHRQM